MYISLVIEFIDIEFYDVFWLKLSRGFCMSRDVMLQNLYDAGIISAIDLLDKARQTKKLRIHIYEDFGKDVENIFNEGNKKAVEIYKQLIRSNDG